MCSEFAVRRVLLLGIVLLAPVAAQDDDGEDGPRPVTAAEAAQLAFPGCEITLRTLSLTVAQQEVVKEAAAVGKVPGEVTSYVARRDGKVCGTAFVDRRTVRTKAQTLLIVVDAEGKVARIEVLGFDEPRRYQPRAEFFAQFHGRVLDDELQLRRGIRSVTGATMSARATVDAVRTVLAVRALPPADR